MAEADWTLEHRIAETLAKVDLPERDLTRTIRGFSGGERTRIAVARLWLEAPDILLLDEPTNNLDGPGRAAILALIDEWRGAAFVASHDRDLLEHVDRIIELTPVSVTIFGGGWSAFAEAREARRAAAVDALDKAETDLRRVKDQVQLQREMKARKDAAGKAGRFTAGQSKMLLDFKQDRAEASQGAANRLADRQLSSANEALDDAKAKFEVLIPLNVIAPSVNLPSQKLVLQFEDVTAEVGGRVLFGPLTFKVTGPERIHIAGGNGAGKSTLLKLITGDRAPASGSIRRLDGRIAMLDQHADTLDDSQHAPAEHARRKPGAGRQHRPCRARPLRLPQQEGAPGRRHALGRRASPPLDVHPAGVIDPAAASAAGRADQPPRHRLHRSDRTGAHRL